MLPSRDSNNTSRAHSNENITSINETTFERGRSEEVSKVLPNDGTLRDESLIKNTLTYEEQLRRQMILNSSENMDYLLAIASQQQKSVEQVKYELILKLVRNIP